LKSYSSNATQRLEPPNSIFLDAALRCIGRGNYVEAEKALDRIMPSLRLHPSVLAARWQISAREQNWETCVDVAKSITKIAPNSPIGWIHLAAAFHATERTREAWELLLRMTDRFPNEPLISYNLACYGCRLGRLKDARTLLEQAFAAGDAATLTQQALQDPDLEPLWGDLAGPQAAET